MHTYLREHTVGGIIGGSFRIYFQNFFTFLVAFLLPVIPHNVLQVIAIEENMPGLLVVALVVGLIAGFIVFAAIILLISDLCLGHKASVARAYKRVFSPILLKLIWANTLQVLAIVIGFLLLVVPGFFVMTWLLFTSTVVILERRSGVAALKRSKELGNTKHWRNFGVFVVLVIVSGAFGGLVGGIMGAIAPGEVGGMIFQLVITLLQLLLMPVSLISIVLMYYDLRVRKEAYNLEALAEDLKF